MLMTNLGDDPVGDDAGEPGDVHVHDCIDDICDEHGNGDVDDDVMMPGIFLDNDHVGDHAGDDDLDDYVYVVAMVAVVTMMLAMSMVTRM